MGRRDSAYVRQLIKILELNELDFIKTKTKVDARALGEVFFATNPRSFNYEDIGMFDIFPSKGQEYFQIKVDMVKRIETFAPDEAEVYVNDAFRIQSMISDIQKQKLRLKDITSNQFEELIAELMSKRGFDVKQTQQTRDGGFDILAYIQGADNSMLKYLVECKHPRTDNKIAVNVIREFKSVCYENHANKGLIFTSTMFTRDAKKEAETRQHIISLKEQMEIMDWIKSY